MLPARRPTDLLTGTNSAWPVPTAAALALGALGAGLATWLGLPAPLLLGPALAVLVAVFFHVPVSVPAPVREAAMLAIGVGVGEAVTREAFASFLDGIGYLWVEETDSPAYALFL